jgi:hypothetical protein
MKRMNCGGLSGRRHGEESQRDCTTIRGFRDTNQCNRPKLEHQLKHTGCAGVSYLVRACVDTSRTDGTINDVDCSLAGVGFPTLRVFQTTIRSRLLSHRLEVSERSHTPISTAISPWTGGVRTSTPSFTWNPRLGAFLLLIVVQ